MDLTSNGPTAPTNRRTIDQVLDAVRSRLVRVAPHEVWRLTQVESALIIDIRTLTDRLVDGVIPGSLRLPRTVPWGAAHRSAAPNSAQIIERERVES